MSTSATTLRRWKKTSNGREFVGCIKSMASLSSMPTTNSETVSRRGHFEMAIGRLNEKIVEDNMPFPSVYEGNRHAC